ncbi:DNA glycosylase [Pisolithus tinctorius]|nr:DNA glycosylase [Pisolithus tinctorius]
MPQTRSATRLSTLSRGTGEKPSQTLSSKRKIGPLHGDDDTTPSKKRSKKQSRTERSVASGPLLPLDGYSDQSTIDAVLTFSFEDAKAHLINVDPRFTELFEQLKCKPFEHLEQVHPFRSLVQSILAQQISWLAARSITHKFLRLYDPSLPEKPTDFSHVKSPQSFFPVPHQVANTDIETLKSAGLSTRKAEYVRDLATRFADGRLSTAKLLTASDEELVEMLTEVRGIGKWTVDMFAIFTLRRPNILPVGDLGIQRGMLRWFGGAGFKIRPDKAAQEDTNIAEKPGYARGEQTKTTYTEVGVVEAMLSNRTDDGNIACGSMSQSNPEINSDSGFDMNGVVAKEDPAVPPATLISSLIPPPSQAFTPSKSSVRDTAVGQENSTGGLMKPWTKPLPHGLTPTGMKSRLDGKKVKGALLTPQEMEALATQWAPYRSLAVYYMWALTEQD